jgi:hypothetical protein
VAAFLRGAASIPQWHTQIKYLYNAWLPAQPSLCLRYNGRSQIVGCGISCPCVSSFGPVLQRMGPTRKIIIFKMNFSHGSTSYRSNEISISIPPTETLLTHRDTADVRADTRVATTNVMSNACPAISNQTPFHHWFRKRPLIPASASIPYIPYLPLGVTICRTPLMVARFRNQRSGIFPNSDPAHW